MLKGQCPTEGESSVFINWIRIVLSMTLFFCSMLTVLWCSHHSCALSFSPWACLVLLLLWNHFLVEWIFSQVWNSVHKDALPIKLNIYFVFSQLGIEGCLLQINEAQVVMSFGFLQPVYYNRRWSSLGCCKPVGSRSRLAYIPHTMIITSFDTSRLEVFKLCLEA